MRVKTTVSIVKNCHGEPSTFKQKFWKWWKSEYLLELRVVSKTGRPSVLQHPIQHLYPLKLNRDDALENDVDRMIEDEDGQNRVMSVCQPLLKRAAADRARTQITTWISDSQIYT